MAEDNVLNLKAMVIAQEALLLSLFRHVSVSDREAILRSYIKEKDSLANALLFDADMTDEELHAINHAHEHLLGLIAAIHSEDEL